MAYALCHQPRSLKHSGRPSSPASSLRNHESYIEGWMSTKPWESRLMEQNHSDSRCLIKCEELNLAGSKLSDASSVRIRRNNVTTRVAAKPPSVLSASSSDFVSDESSPSTSSVAPGSATNILASEARSDSGHGGGPNYMSLTKSAKARLNGGNSHRGQFQIQRTIWGHVILQKGGTLFIRCPKQCRLRNFSHLKEIEQHVFERSEHDKKLGQRRRTIDPSSLFYGQTDVHLIYFLQASS